MTANDWIILWKSVDFIVIPVVAAYVFSAPLNEIYQEIKKAL